MSSSFILLLIIPAVLVGSLLYIIQAEGGISEIPRLLERVGIEVSPPLEGGSPIGVEDRAGGDINDNNQTPIPPEFQSGNSRFSQGACITDSDCTTGGCSNEVCASVSLGGDIDNDGFFTTCEFSPDFPNAQGYSCGCVNGVCGWK